MCSTAQFLILSILCVRTATNFSLLLLTAVASLIVTPFVNYGLNKVDKHNKYCLSISLGIHLSVSSPLQCFAFPHQNMNSSLPRALIKTSQSTSNIEIFLSSMTSKKYRGIFPQTELEHDMT